MFTGTGSDDAKKSLPNNQKFYNFRKIKQKIFDYIETVPVKFTSQDKIMVAFLE